MCEQMPRNPTPKQKKRIDDKLDDALDDTFPASDPPAMTEPSPPPRCRPGAEDRK